MGKRQHDTELWNMPWFRHLTAEQKMLWLYLWDHCDNGGIWIIDFETFEYKTGLKLDESVFDAFNGKCKKINGEIIFIREIPLRLFGQIKPGHTMYKNVNDCLSKIGLSLEKLREQQPKMPEVEL